MIAAAVVALVVVALGQLGTAKGSSRTETEVVTASDGVVQSTVTGTGSLEPVTAEDVDFETSGTLAHVDVRANEYVRKGTLLATLDGTTASLALKQAKATLAEARTTLSGDEKSLDSSGSSDTSDTVEQSGAVAEDVSYSPVSTTRTTTAPATTGTTSTTGTAPTTGTTTATTPTQTATEPARTATEPTRTASQTTTTTAPAATTSTTSSRSATTGSSSSGSSSSGSSSSGSSATVTAATVDADKLQVVEDEQTVRQDQQALDETRLRAPVSGTITSLESISPGDSVSSGSTSSSAGSSSASSTSTTGLASSSSGSSSSSSGSSGSSSFAVIDSLRHLSMTVSFTEADINKLKVGQTAVVTLDALSDLQLAGKVTDVSSIGTTSNDVTSYDATITLDQYDSRVKPGMSASAKVVIRQAHGVTVPSAAVTGTGNLATVREDANGTETTRRVIVGLRGDSRDLIVSGLSAGAELVETETRPSLGSSAGTSSSSSSGSAAAGLGRRLAGGLGGAGGFSGGFGGGAPGGAGVP